MFGEINLKELAKVSGPERAFLSLYLSRPKSMERLEKRIRNARSLLKDNKDELEYFDENIRMVREYLEKNPLESGGLVVFACWVLDFFRAWPLNVEGARGKSGHAGPTLTKVITSAEPDSGTPGAGADLIIVDSSPYIRPLAELQDEYENFAVVVADNKVARIFMVTSAARDSEEKIYGDIKNHVKKGGWSQQRYERRRDKQLLLYAKDIAQKLGELEQTEHFRRVLLVGSRETIGEIRKVLPDQVARKLVGERAVDLRKRTRFVNQNIFEMFFEEERRSEQQSWEQIKAEYLRKGLAAVGAGEVLEAVKRGRVEKAVITRNAQIAGVRCRECENLVMDKPEACPNCSSKSLFEVDMVNEIVELLTLTGAKADFVDPIPGLSEVGDIAALLRY
jgi:peptide chain release factor subunit 1